jgi:two-component system response regulator AtoC
VDAVRSYPWPGNVRELQSAVEYAFVVGEGPVLDLDDVPPELRGEPPDEPSLTSGETSEALSRAKVLGALEKHRWRRAAAAEELGVSRSTLWRAMRELGLTADPRSRKASS